MSTGRKILESIVCNSDTYGPEVSHILPLQPSEIHSSSGNAEKTCWQKVVESFKNIFSKKSDEEELHSFVRRTEKSLSLLKDLTGDDNKGSSRDVANFKKLFSALRLMSEKTELIKECIMNLTFTRYSISSIDEKEKHLRKGKTIIGLYVWICTFCLHTSKVKDNDFWSYFGMIVNKSTLLWLDTTKILAAIEHLREVASHIVHQMEKSDFIVPLKRAPRKYRRKKEEMAKMKHFDDYQTELTWESNLLEPLHYRILYTEISYKKLYSTTPIKWWSFEMLKSKDQLNMQHVLLQYIEAMINQVMEIQSKIAISSIQLDKSICLQPNLETDIILGMIILDEIDTLTLAAKTLKMYVQEVRSIIHICYEFSRYNYGFPTTPTYEELVQQRTTEVNNSFNFMEGILTNRESGMKFNTQSYQDVLRTFPVKTTRFTLILQDVGDVFDLDSLSNKSFMSVSSKYSKRP